MREWQKKVVMAAALALLFLPAIAPLLGNDFTCGYDNTFHLYRTVQVSALWDQGVLLSRWAPDMAHGYGFPLFVFTSPLASMVSAAMHRLLPASWELSLNLTFVLGLVIGGFGMAVLANELFGRGAGVLSAVAYVYAPFQAYDVFNRGSLWECFAWAWVPWALWGLQRWMQSRDRRGLIVGVLSFALMVLSHHLFAFLFAPLLALWVLVVAIQARDWKVFWRGVAFGLLGMGLSAFFWIPPLVEREFVQTGRLLGTWVFDYHYNFLDWQDVFALPRQADRLLLNDWPEKALGAVPVLLGLLPLFAWRKLDKLQRGLMVMLWVLVAGFTFLVLPQSVSLWENVPLLPYVQFPWRYLGPAATALALLIGAGWKALPSGGKRESKSPYIIQDDDGPRSIGWLWIGLVVLLLTLSNLGWFLPDVCPASRNPSAWEMIRFEQASDTIGTTAKGEYLPVWTPGLPEDNPLIESYQEYDKAVARMFVEDMPVGVKILEQEIGPTSGRIILNSPVEFTARYHVLYYPGWQVYVGGKRVPVTPDGEMGILTFDVPAGGQLIEARFVETPLRLIADGISGVALVLLIWVALKAERVPEEEDQSDTGALWWLMVLAVAVLVLRFVVMDRLPLLWRGSRFDESVLAGAPASLDVNFGNRARLLDWEPLPESVQANAAPVLTLYWQALNPEDKEWRIGVALIAADGASWQAGIRPVRSQKEAPMLSQWPPDRYARMDYHLDLPAGMPPGVYEISLVLFDRASGEPASVLDLNGNPIAPAYSLGQIEVTSPAQVPSLHELGVESTEMTVCGGVGLWQMSADREQAAPGELVALRWVWQTVGPVNFGLYSVHVVAADGNPQKVWLVPLNAQSRGQRWVQQALLRLPGSLESGEYALVLGLPGCDAMASVPVTVIAPERIWDVPEDYAPVDAQYGEVVRLAGVRVMPDALVAGSDVEIALAWEALAEMDTSYRVFVHVVRLADAVVVAQKDSEPANWSRPTTGWAVGEVVLDARVVSLPGELEPGAYEVRVGLYTSEGRLAVGDGDYFVVAGFEE